MQAKHFYRTSTDSECGRKLTEFSRRCTAAEMLAESFAKLHGATAYYESPLGMAGGVACFVFDKEPDHRLFIPDPDMLEMQKVYGTKDTFYTPNLDTEEGRAIDKEREDLPIVSELELIDILQVKPVTNSAGRQVPMVLNETPIIFMYLGMWYVGMKWECECPGLNPITEKEFYRRRLAATNTQ